MVVHAFFDMSLNGRFLGRLIFALREDLCPQTVSNFLQLCAAPAGVGYRGTTFYQITTNWAIKGGDTNGQGGRSIWGTFFPDENFLLQHNGRGTISMNNSGPNQNGSQFFITLRREAGALAHLNNRHVVFGQVIAGWDVLEAIERQGGSADGVPVATVVVVNCGTLTA